MRASHEKSSILEAQYERNYREQQTQFETLVEQQDKRYGQLLRHQDKQLETLITRQDAQVERIIEPLQTGNAIQSDMDRERLAEVLPKVLQSDQEEQPK